VLFSPFGTLPKGMILYGSGSKFLFNTFPLLSPPPMLQSAALLSHVLNRITDSLGVLGDEVNV
jgi:hypothetical protein